MVRVLCLMAATFTMPSLPAWGAEEQSAPPPMPAWDLSEFPVFTGKVIQVLGHQNSFIPPKVGATFRLDLSQPSKVDKLAFDEDGPERASYISLATGKDGVSPLVVESLKTYTNGAFDSMRMVSRSALRDSHRVKVDVQYLPGRGDPNFVQLWIIEEEHVTRGVVLVEGTVNKAVPKPVPMNASGQTTFDGKDPIETAVAFLQKNETDLSKHDVEKAAASRYCPPQSTVYQWCVHIPARADSKAEDLWIALPEKGDPWRLDPITLEKLAD